MWSLAVSVMNGSVITLFCLQNVRSGFIIALQMPRQSVNYFLVQMSLSARSVWIVTTP